MKIEVLADAEAVAQRAAAMIAAEAEAGVRERGRFVFAVSGGRTPWIMLRVLAEKAVPWEDVHIVQVDERVAPEGHADRNLTHLRAALHRSGLNEGHLHAMPVEDLEGGAARYAGELAGVAGVPPVLDLVHLGLGGDGHTASLVPGDAALDVDDSDVAVTAEYQGRRRMTLTYPILNRARRVLWVVTGAEKADMLQRLMAADRLIPAGRVRQEKGVLIADAASSVRTSVSR